MLNHQTIEGLYALNLPAMATGLAEQAGSATHQQLSFDERLGLLVDRELAEPECRRLELNRPGFDGGWVLESLPGWGRCW